MLIRPWIKGSLREGGGEGCGGRVEGLEEGRAGKGEERTGGKEKGGKEGKGRGGKEKGFAGPM